ncbi:tpr repeat-containing protein [Anaeramoeba flamelloides]|uniref:Tpr repeat-containing protein n=1 Tax=Anaeramoeba flamelloides TaxID=1746091 RepID=A0ABQ8Y6X7_9EUKA|nr:tpr repeat-containing protein [Anaeramoeba flamelloides]
MNENKLQPNSQNKENNIPNEQDERKKKEMDQGRESEKEKKETKILTKEEQTEISEQIKQAEKFYLQGKPDYARDLYLKILQKDDTNTVCLNNLATMYLKLNNNELAKEAYQKVIEINPDHLNSNYQLANLYLKENHFHQAKKIYLKILDTNKGHVGCLRNLAYLYFHNKEYDLSLVYSNKLIAQNPKNLYKVYNDVGSLYIRLTQFKMAVSYFQKSIQMNGNFSKSHFNLGRVYTKLEFFKFAIESYEKSIAIDPEYLDSYINLSALYLKKGLVAESKKKLSFAYTYLVKQIKNYAEIQKKDSRLKNEQEKKSLLTLQEELQQTQFKIAKIYFVEGKIEKSKNFLDYLSKRTGAYVTAAQHLKKKIIYAIKFKQHLEDLLKKTNRDDTLDLSHYSVFGDMWNDLARFLQKSKWLRVLIFKGAKIPVHALQMIADSLESNDTITHLTIRNCIFSYNKAGKLIGKIIKNLKSLKVLDLSHSSFKYKSTGWLFSALYEGAPIETLKIKGIISDSCPISNVIELLSLESNLQNLHISGEKDYHKNWIDPFLKQGLLKNNQLKQIVMKNYQPSNEALSSLVQFVKNSKSIERVYLSMRYYTSGHILDLLDSARLNKNKLSEIHFSTKNSANIRLFSGIRGKILQTAKINPNITYFGRKNYLARCSPEIRYTFENNKLLKKNLIQDFHLLYQRQEQTDLNFCNKRIKIHSPILKFVLKQNWERNSIHSKTNTEFKYNKVLRILNDKKNVNFIEKFFKWCYTGSEPTHPHVTNICSQIGILYPEYYELKCELKELYSKQDEKDFTLIAFDGEVKIHKFILQARSELFRGLFFSADVTSINDYTGRSKLSLEIMCKFLYTQKFDPRDFIINNEKNELLYQDLLDVNEYYQFNKNIDWEGKLYSAWISIPKYLN